MIRPPIATALLAVVLSVITAAHAQGDTPLHKIVFPKYNTAPGWTRYQPDRLTPNPANFQHTNGKIDFWFRGYVSHGKKITYALPPLAVGSYRIKLGFLEKGPCEQNGRGFSVKVGSVQFEEVVDVFKSVGCLNKHVIEVNFQVANSDDVILVLEKAYGRGPILNNFEIFQTSTTPPDDPGPPTLPTSASVSFTKWGTTPVGFTRFDQAAISPSDNVKFQVAPSASFSGSPQFRFQVKRAGGFSYTHAMANGMYTVKLGFMEYTTSSACVNNKRVFTANANGVASANIDIFKDAGGCGVEHVVTLNGVSVSGGELVIEFSPLKNWAPILSNFVVTASGTNPSDPPTPSAKPTATAEPSPPAGDLPSSAQVVFTFWGTPPAGFTKFVPARASPNGYSVQVGGPDVTQSAYKYHIKRAGGFVYKQPLKNGVYTVRLGFLEFPRSSACVDSKRVFRVVANGVDSGRIDVFRDASGCGKILNRFLRNVQVTDGLLTIDAKPIKGFAPFLSNFAAAPGTTVTPTKVDKKINVGPEGAVANTKSAYYGGAIQGFSGTPLHFYRTSRFGSDFKYSFNLQPGAYDITLGFSENYFKHCDVPGRRVFHVYINDAIQLEGYDIFADVGCYKATQIVLKEQTVEAINPEPLTINFVAVSNFAQVNYIRVKTSVKVCVPEFAVGSLDSDHAAHAVPGVYPEFGTSYVDDDGNGFERIFIDGKGSHTHYFDAQNNIPGRLTKYEWSLVETNEVISTAESFTRDFPLGGTRLKLAVIDNSCSRSEAETTVTVTGKIQQGVYCYFYDPNSLTEPLLIGALTDTPRPSFSAILKSLSMGFPSFGFDDSLWTARCTFFLNRPGDTATLPISVSTGGTGNVKVFKGEDLVIDSETLVSSEIELASGLTAFELIYTRTEAGKTPVLKFLVNGAIPANNLISYDRSTILPILSAVEPKTGKVSGGAKVKVLGYGLFGKYTVTIGGKKVPRLSTGFNSKQFFIKTPAVPEDVIANITITSDVSGFTSNAVQFTYGTACDDVAFEKTSMKRIVLVDGKEQEAEVNTIGFTTSVTIGTDGNLYLGGLGGRLHVVGYDLETLIAKTHCYSEFIPETYYKKPDGSPSPRNILGIALNPREKINRPVVSSSIIYFRDKNTIAKEFADGWMSGAIDRFTPNGRVGMSLIGSPEICLLYEKRLVSNMPVSNHDHAINGILFKQDGNLLIACGGNTNLGLPGWKLGGMWETQFSGAVLEAKLTKPGFDGVITWDTTRHEIAKVTSTDVVLYATGFRNLFGITMNMRGQVYGADQGPNCQYGNTATACDEFDPEEYAENYSLTGDKDWPGRVKNGWVKCPYGPGRPDKVHHIRKGMWYGHANLNRGPGYEDECAWIDQYTGKTAKGADPPARYVPPLTWLKPSTTGIGEYGASHFCSKLRGEIILSKYKGLSTLRMKLSPDGTKVVSGPDEIAAYGAIAYVEDARGNMIFPQVFKGRVNILKPKITKSTNIEIFGVTPRRHGSEGGTTIRVGGDNFPADVVVVFVQDGKQKNCPIVSMNAISIFCIVPSRLSVAGDTVGVKVKSPSLGEAVLPNAVLYMDPVA